MSSQKFVLSLVLVAVTVAAAITVPNVFVRMADWLLVILDKMEPGQIAGGATQSYLGNAAHSAATCAVDSWHAGNLMSKSCWVTGIVVIVILTALISTAACKQALKERLERMRDEASRGNNHADARNAPAIHGDPHEVRIKMEHLENVIRTEIHEAFRQREAKQYPGG